MTALDRVVAVRGFAAWSQAVCIDPSPDRLLSSLPPRRRRMSSVAAQTSWLAGSLLTEMAGSAVDRAALGFVLGLHFARAECVERAALVARSLGLKDHCDPGAFVSSIGSAVVGQVALDHGLRGASMAVANGDASGVDAIGLAFRLLRAARQRAFLAGGADSAEGIAAMRRSGELECLGPVECTGGAGLVSLHVGAHEGELCVLRYETGQHLGHEPGRVLHELLAERLPPSHGHARLLVVLNDHAQSNRDAADWPAVERWNEPLRGNGAAGGALATVRALEWLRATHRMDRGATATVCTIAESGAYSVLTFGFAEVGQ